ncbi:tyrosinase family protein [Cupriavidus sp. WKF15]|uniref:DUF7868 domain-containing protein n=1 Tax=Cupriavidus sp. WKF15 TaxID=3032282 RepID=UPI0023E0E42A|nr:tyrosinase family protein [Cupriavidus sp. WKF15]WER50524.1 tyrosinase family protein [Cupriavidus sp. WKF15]
MHGGKTHGGIESQPHDWVHGLVGGASPQSGVEGLMSLPDTAGLDPIFWLHHCNIDRLWQVWRTTSASHADPSSPNWLKGPEVAGRDPFVLPKSEEADWTFTPEQMTDIAKLGYAYDDTSLPTGLPHPALRLERLGASPEAAHALARSQTMTASATAELLGANKEAVRLVGSKAETAVALDASISGKVAASLQAIAAAAPSAPDRVFLNLENVRSNNDAVAFKVYVNLPSSADPAQHPELQAGSIALFGASSASVADDTHAGDGLTYVLDISHIIDAMHLAGNFPVGALSVRLVPVHPVPESANVTVGRVSVFRQGN